MDKILQLTSTFNKSIVQLINELNHP